MIGGMLPSAFGLGSGGEFRAPMAIAVIGGLLSSMLLSLLFVPPVFSVMDDIAGMIWGYFRRCVGEADEPAEPARPTPRRTGAANAQGLPIAAEEKPGRRRGKSTEPPARIRRVAGPHRLPLGGCLRPARRIPCSMVEILLDQLLRGDPRSQDRRPPTGSEDLADLLAQLAPGGGQGAPPVASLAGISGRRCGLWAVAWRRTAGGGPSRGEVLRRLSAGATQAAGMRVRRGGPP